jgi:hypothetical protein
MDIYRVTTCGTPVGIGVSGSTYLHLSAIGKSDSATERYCVANEMIAAEVGRRLRLPVPPFCVVQDGVGQAFFASLDFNLTGLSLPPVIPPTFAAQFPQAVADLLVFDIYIGNSDRHAGNLNADYGAGRYNVFDHSHAVFGGTHHGITGESRLGAISGALVIDGSSGGNKHCLIGTITDDHLMLEMLSRVESLEDYFLTDIVEAAFDYGLSVQEKAALLNFLMTRRHQVRQLILANKASFPSIQQWSLL